MPHSDALRQMEAISQMLASTSLRHLAPAMQEMEMAETLLQRNTGLSRLLDRTPRFMSSVVEMLQLQDQHTSVTESLEANIVQSFESTATRHGIDLAAHRQMMEQLAEQNTRTAESLGIDSLQSTANQLGIDLLAHQRMIQEAKMISQRQITDTFGYQDRLLGTLNQRSVFKQTAYKCLDAKELFPRFHRNRVSDSGENSWWFDLEDEISELEELGEQLFPEGMADNKDVELTAADEELLNDLAMKANLANEDSIETMIDFAIDLGNQTVESRSKGEAVSILLGKLFRFVTSAIFIAVMTVFITLHGTQTFNDQVEFKKGVEAYQISVKHFPEKAEAQYDAIVCKSCLAVEECNSDLINYELSVGTNVKFVEFHDEDVRVMWRDHDTALLHAGWVNGDNLESYHDETTETETLGSPSPEEPITIDPADSSDTRAN